MAHSAEVTPEVQQLLATYAVMGSKNFQDYLGNLKKVNTKTPHIAAGNITKLKKAVDNQSKATKGYLNGMVNNSVQESNKLAKKNNKEIHKTTKKIEALPYEKVKLTSSDLAA